MTWKNSGGKITINLLKTDINLKIVLCGPERSGKTSIITYLYLNTKRRYTSPLTSYTNLVGRTIFFDHLRVLYGRAGGKNLFLDIFTAPGAPPLLERRKEALYLADAVILTLDSSRKGRVKNLKSAAELMSILRAEKKKPSRFPIIYLYHKDEMADRSTCRLFKRLYRRYRAPETHASAYEGYGIWEALDKTVQLALSNEGIHQDRRFDIREKVLTTMAEFDEIYKRFYLRKADFGHDSHISLGKKLIRIDPSNKDFLLDLADAFEREGAHDKARKYRLLSVRSVENEGDEVIIRQAADEKKNPIIGFERDRYLDAAYRFERSGETKRAERAMKLALSGAYNPYDKLMLLKKLAELKVRQGKTEEGLNSLSRLANRFNSRGYYREALSLFYLVLSHRPSSLECLLGAGKALDSMDRFADALIYFERAKRVMSEGRIFMGRVDVDRRIKALTRKLAIFLPA